jgi:CRP-like cAMP-binding protein
VALRKNAKIELIKTVPLFSRCSKRELAAVAGLADELVMPAGRALATQGAPGREFVIIVDGTAEVSRDGKKINQLGAGDFLGEIALISGSPRTATVTTTSETRLLVLTDRAFRRLTADMPSTYESVSMALAERLQADAL